VITKDLTSIDNGSYICGVCGQHVSIDKINFMDGHDYQYWAAGMVCDDCLHNDKE